MTPAPEGPPLLTETEYWRDYDIIRNDVNAAMVSCYTHRAINHVAVADRTISQRLNRHADFWRVMSFGLHNSLFIVLARILDSDSRLHSIYQVLNATTGHPEFFSKAALRARKLSIPGAEPKPAVARRVCSKRMGTDRAGSARAEEGARTAQNEVRRHLQTDSQSDRAYHFQRRAFHLVPL
jgi:hypothetical protein